jgi:hypothetical protein
MYDCIIAVRLLGARYLYALQPNILLCPYHHYSLLVFADSHKRAHDVCVPECTIFYIVPSEGKD